MATTLIRLDPTGADHGALVDFLTSNEFPFHVRSSPTREQVEASIAQGAFQDAENDSFWIEDDAHGRVGALRLEDLQDDTPLFDLRLDEAFRGRGLGAAALHAATDHVFGTMPQANRFEGQTREDNIAMRKAFVRCGWLKEAHYREGWPVDGATPVASVAYAILRTDWESGETTTFGWDDLAD